MADRPSRSAQRGGAGAQQVQISGNVVVGVTPTEAMEIAGLVAREVIAAFTAGALAEANKRIDDFDRRLVDVLDQEQSLNAFSDPAFQILVKKAQRSAAASGRESDYDRLAELLSNRAHEEDRKKRAAADRAVEVVDLVDDDALAGLTAARFFMLQFAVAGTVQAGLDQYERFAAAVLELPLPSGDEWIEHLDSLGLARISRSEHFNSAHNLLEGTFKGFICRGLENTPDKVIAYYQQATALGVKVRMEPHELNPGYLRLPVSSDAAIRNIEGSHPEIVGSYEQFIEAARPTGYGTSDPVLMAALLEQIGTRPATSALIQWWNEPRVGFRHTSAGTLLASANTKRLLRTAGLSS